MQPSLKWAFGLSALASSIALMWPVPSVDGITLPAEPSLRGPGPIVVSALPENLPTQDLKPTKLDPFATRELPPPPTQLALQPLPAPEPVRAPAMAYRYFGSFTGPDGTRLVYLAKSDRYVLIKQGAQLEDGYSVEAIGQTTVTLVHAATQTRIDIPIAMGKETP